jgi:hypothetical protein
MRVAQARGAILQVKEGAILAMTPESRAMLEAAMADVAAAFGWVADADTFRRSTPEERRAAQARLREARR